jgi:glycosyltransferase involved in cell wall biosynthesis
MPNSLMEAMALGIPVISTDCPCGGPAELITDGFDGLLVPIGKVEPMKEAMERVLSDDRFRKELGENAFKIRDRLDPEKVNKQWEDYLSSFIQQ